MNPGVGFALHPDESFLERTAPLLELVDYVEVTPETLWREVHDDDGAVLHLVDNGYRKLIVELADDLPFVAHGVGLGLGNAHPGEESREAARFARWMKRIEEEHRRLQFGWYTDHAGAPFLDDNFMQLPLPVPLTASRAAHARERLCAIRDVVGAAGIENTAQPFVFGRALDEPAWLASCIDAPGLVLLLDLMNVVVMARNLSFDAREYLQRLPLDRVIEIHVAGSIESDPSWLPSGRTLLVDGHDDRVPDEVWSLLEWTVPRCSALQGVTLERREGTLADGAADVTLLREELARIRRMVA